jgi:hypothetical protein
MLQAEEQERMAVGIIETKAKRISDPGQRQDYLQAVMCAP